MQSVRTVVAPPPGATVTAARSIPEVEGLRPVWERLQGASLPSDIDYFLTVARHNPEIVRPHVLMVEPAVGAPSLLAAHVSRLRVPHRLGPWVAYAPRLRVLNVFRGVVGDPSGDELATALSILRRDLGNGIDAILLRNVPVRSTLHETALSVFPSHSRQRFLGHRARWDADISASADRALEALSESTRGNLRRAERRLERTFGNDLRIELYDSPGDAETVFRDIDAVAEKTYQTKMQPIFRDAPLERELTRLGLEKGWFRAYLLYVGDRPVSFWTGFSYAGTFGWRGFTGYDPEFRSFGVGKYLLSAMLDQLARDPSITRLTLGVGDLPYKSRFGGRGEEEVDVRIFASTPRATFANYVGAGVQGVHAGFRAARALPVVGRHLDAQHEGIKRRQRRTHD